MVADLTRRDEGQAGTPAISSIADIFQSSDGLSKVAQLFGEVGGRELSPDALACLAFLEENGSGDLAARVLRNKRFQLPLSDIIKFTEVLSPATANKEMMEQNARLIREARG